MLEGIMNDAFDLKEGGVIILPEEFRTTESKSKETFPETTRVLIVWREKDSARCHFNLDVKMDGYVKRIVVFISDKAKAGDSLKILWIEGNCVGTTLLPAEK